MSLCAYFPLLSHFTLKYYLLLFSIQSVDIHGMASTFLLHFVDHLWDAPQMVAFFFFSDPCRPRRLPSERRCGQGVEREPMFGDGQQVLHVLEPPSWPIFLRCDETTNHAIRSCFFLWLSSTVFSFSCKSCRCLMNIGYQHMQGSKGSDQELHSLKYQLQVDCRHPNMLGCQAIFATFRHQW